ncbi:DNA primase small subunit [Orchesella cincta]|uniref:DNA primase n=1 Tax=Orchesella cincta TaxID=48709 RepID=A0A1D2M194_ORCCI|nr:DNA primase small subunit [Orchesella cincta]
MYRWLSYGNPGVLFSSEFSFHLLGCTFATSHLPVNEDFVAELKRKETEKKEFVLDIDLTDYDDVANMLPRGKVCEKCWKFIAVAVKIMDASLRAVSRCSLLGCDKEAINLDSHSAAAILEYLTVIRGGENQAKKSVCWDYLMMCLMNLPVMIKVFWRKGTRILKCCRREVKAAVKDSEQRFNAVMTYINDNKKKRRRVRTALYELKLQLCFPRLDVNVSKDLNHLLKSPFCVASETGKVCVPFDPKKAFEFDTDAVPSITQLLNEINAFDKSQKSEGEPEQKETKTVVDFKKTSLAPFIKIFEGFVKNLEKERIVKSAADNKILSDKSNVRIDDF